MACLKIKQIGSTELALMSCDYGKDFLEELKWGNRISSMHNTKHHPHFLVHFRTENSDSFFTKIQIFLCRKQKKEGVEKGERKRVTKVI